jgi:hypothetical protein
VFHGQTRGIDGTRFFKRDIETALDFEGFLKKGAFPCQSAGLMAFRVARRGKSPRFTGKIRPFGPLFRQREPSP